MTTANISLHLQYSASIFADVTFCFVTRIHQDAEVLLPDPRDWDQGRTEGLRRHAG